MFDQATCDDQSDELDRTKPALLTRVPGRPGGGSKWPPSLDQLLDAERVRRTGAGGPTASADYDDIRSRYEKAHGGIADLYIAKNIEGAGAVLTGLNEVKVRYPADQVAALQPEFEEALWRATAMSREGNQLLSGRQANILAAMIQSVVVYLLGVLDSQHRSLPAGDSQATASSPERIEKSLNAVRQELDRIRIYLRRSAQATAQRFYLQGMLLGVPTLPLLALAVARVRIGDVPALPLVIAGVAGGVGALISVMTRITSGKLTLDCHCGRGVLRLAGAFRPLIGAIMGMVVYVIIRADLIPVAVPAPPRDLYLFSAVAFLAGFSERWAQDMLAKTGAVAVPSQLAPPSRRTEGKRATSDAA
jgi:hypothetical protein